jgi:para-aminobenzoate synthetase / 4-amino-4-deoxychorismate lyase
MWNRRGEVTESTIANVVAEIDGVRYTPPLACGLLGGTLRGELLVAGAIRERVMSRDDVANATRLWLINSLREWVEARLVSTSNHQRPTPNVM